MTEQTVVDVDSGVDSDHKITMFEVEPKTNKLQGGGVRVITLIRYTDQVH